MNIILVVVIIFLALFLLDRVLFLDMSRLGWKRAKVKMPDVARRFNLTYLPSPQKHQMGAAKGIFGGYEVSIEPDSNASIKIEIPGLSALHISTTAPGIAPFAEGMENFDFGNPDIDRLFRTRRVEAGKRVVSDTDSKNLAATLEFFQKWKFKIRYLKLSMGTMTCSFKYGQATYIPDSALNELLTRLTALASTLETTLTIREQKE